MEGKLLDACIIYNEDELIGKFTRLNELIVFKVKTVKLFPKKQEGVRSEGCTSIKLLS